MKEISKHAQTGLAVHRIVTALLLIEYSAPKLGGFPAPGVSGAGSEGDLTTLMLIFVLIGVLTRPVAFLLSGQMAPASWYYPFHRQERFSRTLRECRDPVLLHLPLLSIRGAGR
ncbi:hypothetical protein ACXHXG_20340 [Rhizobium sp. LEGMi198b]